ncbi:MAG: hypothetical protein ACYDAR_01130 [Thermomicrobiales bacterium]
MKEHEIQGTPDESHDGEGGAIPDDWASARWALFVIGVALLLILRTI